MEARRGNSGGHAIQRPAQASRAATASAHSCFLEPPEPCRSLWICLLLQVAQRASPRCSEFDFKASETGQLPEKINSEGEKENCHPQILRPWLLSSVFCSLGCGEQEAGAGSQQPSKGLHTLTHLLPPTF